MNSNYSNTSKLLDLNLDESNGLKGIALILLLIHHLFYIQNGQYDDIDIHGHGIVNVLGKLCKVCVAIFVFLSGYGLGISISGSQKLNIRRFYIRRFTKLFLNYWMIWILFVPIGIIFFDRRLETIYGEEGWIYCILDLLGLLNITGRLGYNPTWWFYSCIILLYLIFPIIAYTIHKYPKTIWLYLLAGIVIIEVPIIYISPIRYYFFPFVLGILFAKYLNINTLPPPYKIPPLPWTTTPHAMLHTQPALTNTSNSETVSTSYFNYYYNAKKIIVQNEVRTTKRKCNRFWLFLDSMFCDTLGVGGIIVVLLLLTTACIIRLLIPYALLWDTCIALIIILLYKNFKRIIKIQTGLEFLGKHSFNIFLFHTFIYYLYFPFLIYWSSNPLIIFISLLASSVAISMGIERLKVVVGFYRLQEWIMR